MNSLHVALVSLTALFGACDDDELAPLPRGRELGTSVDADLGIKGKTRTFAPDDTIHASIDTRKRSAGTVVSAMFTGPNGDVVHQASIVIAPEAKGHTEFHFQKRGLPAGNYVVDVLVGGEPVRTSTFTVR